MATGAWTEADVPEQVGRTIVVTGASAGIGFQAARVLASRGARVVLACRDTGRARQAAERIRAMAGSASLAVVPLDLASLASVRDAAAQIRASCPRLDVLINNAGVMEPPYQRTEDGFELTFATNHLGHFALTGLVLGRLLATPGSRIVNMSSVGHLEGVMDFADLQGERGYQPAAAYHQSKLANLLFTYELSRRLRDAGVGTSALAAHPGVVYTGLFRTRPKLEQLLMSPALRVINFWAVQDVRMGVLPMLRAATDPTARSGEYYGPRPRRFLRYPGYPGPVESSARSHDRQDQARLWEVSERLTGVSYRIAGSTALS